MVMVLFLGERSLDNMSGKVIIDSALTKTSMKSHLVKGVGRVFLVAVLLASVQRGFSSEDMQNARKELLRRGLLTEADL